MLAKIAYYAKAVAGGLVAGSAALTAALSDNHVTTAEWVTIVVAAVAGTGLVGLIPNKAKGSQ